jgi:predicted PurR-regulated permease PerM
VLAWAVVMTVLFYPVHRRIDERLGRPALAALLSTALVALTILGPTAIVASATVSELRDFSAAMPATVEGWLSPSNVITGRVVRLVEQWVSLDPLRNPAFVEESLQGWGSEMATGSLQLVGGAMSVVAQMALVVFTMFFLFKDARRIRSGLYDLVPIENQRLRSLLDRTRDVIIASVYGTLLLAVIQGALGGLAFWVLGLPSPFLWGSVMIVASLVPLLGAFVVWGPATIYLVASGQIWQAIALALWGTAVIGLADNVLRPSLVGSRTQMHELLVLFGVLGGLSVFGVLGLVIGPVSFAVTLALAEALRDLWAPVRIGRTAA